MPKGRKRTLAEIEFDIEVDITPPTPGRFTGLPENCYPDDPGECEIVDIQVYGQTVNDRLYHYIENLFHREIWEEAINE